MWNSQKKARELLTLTSKCDGCIFTKCCTFNKTIYSVMKCAFYSFHYRLGVPYITANIYCKSRNLPNTNISEAPSIFSLPLRAYTLYNIQYSKIQIQYNTKTIRKTFFWRIISNYNFTYIYSCTIWRKKVFFCWMISMWIVFVEFFS